MKHLITFILLTITTFISAQDNGSVTKKAENAQNFEGTLTYFAEIELSQKMIAKGMTIEMIKSKGTFIDTIKTTYKNGFYKQLMFSTDTSWVIYRNDSNKLYHFEVGTSSEFCTVTEGTTDYEFKMGGKMPKVTLLDTIVKYKNYELKMVEVKWKSGIYYYLFNENYFHINPEIYKGHIYDGFYAFLNISHSLPIVMIKKAGGVMTTTFSLINSSETKIDDSLFQLPKLIVDEEFNQSHFSLGQIMKIIQ
jgi:hypothetical protein